MTSAGETGVQPRPEVQITVPPSEIQPAAKPVARGRLERVAAALVPGSVVKVVLWAALGVILLALLYVASVHAFPGNSDGATPPLEAQSILSGHPALSGWALSLDSFWTVDVPFYILGVALLGVSPALLHLIPALIGTLVVLVGMGLARDGRRGLPGWVGAGTVVAILGLPASFLANFFLQGPLHVATTLWCLLAFVGLRRGRFGWGWGAAVILLAAGLLGDFQMLALGVAPVAGAGVLAMLRRRRVAAGAAPLSAAVGGVVLAEVVRQLAKLAGTFTMGSTGGLASNGQMAHNVGAIGKLGPELLGLQASNVPAWLEDVRVAGVVLIVGALALAAAVLLWSLIRGLRAGSGGAGTILGSSRADRAPAGDGVAGNGVDGAGVSAGDSVGALVAAQSVRSEVAWRLDDLLLLGVLADLVMFVALSATSDFNFARYLTPGVIFGAILAGRMVTRLAVGVRGSRLAPLAGAGATIIGLFYLAGFSWGLTGPPPPNTALQLSHMLAARGLHQGVGAYWDSSLVTVSSSERVTVRPVIATPQGRLLRYQRQSPGSWYRGKSFNFFVYEPASPWNGVNSAAARRTWGAPAQVINDGPYRVLVYAHPFRVSPTAMLPAGHPGLTG